MNEEPKPCPWCRSAPDGPTWVAVWGWYEVLCRNLNCPAQPEVYSDVSADEAVRRWNTRVGEGDPAER